MQSDLSKAIQWFSSWARNRTHSSIPFTGTCFSHVEFESIISAFTSTYISKAHFLEHTQKWDIGQACSIKQNTVKWANVLPSSGYNSGLEHWIKGLLAGRFHEETILPYLWSFPSQINKVSFLLFSYLAAGLNRFLNRENRSSWGWQGRYEAQILGYRSTSWNSDSVVNSPVFVMILEIFGVFLKATNSWTHVI